MVEELAVPEVLLVVVPLLVPEVEQPEVVKLLVEQVELPLAVLVAVVELDELDGLHELLMEVVESVVAAAPGFRWVLASWVIQVAEEEGEDWFWPLMPKPVPEQVGPWVPMVGEQVPIMQVWVVRCSQTLAHSRRDWYLALSQPAYFVQPFQRVHPVPVTQSLRPKRFQYRATYHQTQEGSNTDHLHQVQVKPQQLHKPTELFCSKA